MWVRALADASADAGGKAGGLARACAAGLRVPDGFVVETGAFAAIAQLGGALDGVGHDLDAIAARIERAELPELEREVEARAAALGVVSVRSSAAIEDRARGAAPGVFASVIGVPAADVWPAIRTVWTSALTALAASYARGQSLAMAVVVHRFVAGERVTVYTRPPGAPAEDCVWIQRGEQLDRLRRDAGDPIVDAALAAERAIAAHAGADVELVVGDDAPWIVQVRPIVHPPAPAPALPPPAPVLAALVADGRTWTWDVAHNPDPLSVAQTELVELVERAGFAPWSLRVCAGYLYTAPRAPERQITIAGHAELAARAAEIERACAEILVDTDDLDAALAAYLAFYRLWVTELVPLIRVARRGLEPSQLLGARPSAVEVTILAAARDELDEAAVLAKIGTLAPAWDVAVPTFAEQPEPIRLAIARARAFARSCDPTPRSAEDEVARLGAELAERDDLWFARAQWLVRRAILKHAATIGVTPDDAFWISLAELRSPNDLDSLRRRAAGARAAAARAARWSMPLVVGTTDDNSRASRAPLVGSGSGGRVRGRVVRIDSLVRAATIGIGRGDVIVARAITPALAVIVIGCAAIVSETGGPLDHGAAMARELGIPCVVGCRDAWTLLSDGMLVAVDGNAGTVTR